MAEVKRKITKKVPADDDLHSISSKSVRSARTVSFTVPTLPRPQFSRDDRRQRMAAFVIVAFLAVFASGAAGAWVESHYNETGLISTTVGNEKKVVTSTSQLISQIAKTVGPSVVSVNVDINGSATNTDTEQDFGAFGFTQPQAEQAAGTGIVISNNIILTNRHVVPDGTTSVSITLSDGTELKNVSVLGRTSDTDSLDIAFLKVNDLQGHKLTPAVIGDSSKVQVGDDVVAIGNALGQFQNTVTSGIISGYGRSVQASSDSSGSDGSTGSASAADTESLDNLFQTDAAINEGNSGGPLVNLNGQVIGINTAIAGDAQNIGFAIPINDVQGLINQVLKTGKFQRPYLGVHYIPITADVADSYNLSVQNGAYIAPSNDPANSSVVSGSPADKAGLQEKDIITQVDGTSIDQAHSLTSLLDSHEPGDKITLTVLRGSDTLHIDATLAAAPTS